MVVMSAGALAFVALAAIGAMPIAWTLYRAPRNGAARRLLAPLVLACAGLAVFVAASLHFGHGWPGTGGHPWSERGLVPTAAARPCWAATLWITSYWAHPGALASFPAAEVACMVASPLATLAAVVGSTVSLRRLSPSGRVLRFEARLARAAAGVMAAFLAGAGSWMLSGGPAARRPATCSASARSTRSAWP
jgi:hypothetical protein